MRIAHAVEGNHQRLDGGAMFGNVPRALWSRWYEPDEQGRIELACRALLIDEGQRKLLFETGIGAFFEPKLKERYGVLEDEHVLLESLGRLGLSHEDIDVVVLSHLHFDHAGGLLERYAPGKKPSLLFPKAQFLVGKLAWERAKNPHPRDRASFIEPLPELLEKTGRLVVVEEGAGGHPLLGDGYRLSESFGHTPGMLHAEVRGRHRGLFFCADLVPGSAWVHLPVTMGYDRYPERLIDEKNQVFREVMTHGTDLFFTHDPDVIAGRLQIDEKGRYSLSERYADFAFGWDLDAIS